MTAAPWPPPMQAEPRPKRCLARRRVCRRHEPVLLEVGLEPGEPLGRGGGPHMLIGAEVDGLAFLLYRDRDRLVLEPAGVPRLVGALLRAERPRVHFLAGEFVFLG